MGAVFSTDRRCRYLLDRDLGGSGPVMSIGMINPSIANETDNDKTVTRVVGFGQRLGASKVILWNQFAAITPYVRELRDMVDPVGPDNDGHIIGALLSSQIHVVAWGPLSKLPKPLRLRRHRIIEIGRDLGVRFMCWDTAQDGQPKHPLMLPYALHLRPWEAC